MQHKQVPTPAVPEKVEFETFTPTDEQLASKQRADELFRANQREAAFDDYERLLAQDIAGEFKARVLHNAAISTADVEHREQLLRQAIEIDPRYKKARLRLARMFAEQDNWLAAQIEYTHVEEIGEMTDGERAEKEVADKKAMQGTLDVLKGWGNKILGKFGMSTDDFHTVKNPDGTVSIQMQKKQ